MTWGPQPGGPPPPPPPAPEEQRPPAWDSGLPPAFGGTKPPRGTGRPAAFVILAVALAVSLASNVILALRVKDETDAQDRLRGEVSALQRELDALQRQQGGTGAVSVLDRVAAAVEKLRALKFKAHVDPELLSDQQLRARVEEQFRKDNPRSEIDQSDKVLTTLGLLGPADDLFEILLGVHTEQVGGFYDTTAKKLVVGGNANNPSPLDRVLLAHEYVHAVTDQFYNLSRIDTLQNEHKDDEALALIALAEGDATVMMLRYSQQYLTPEEQRDVVNESGAIPTERLDKAPAWLKQSLLFPYQQGVDFVQQVLDSDGGIDALNKAYQNPPTSTEQILHPSRFLGRRDDPQAVAVQNLAEAMGAGWSQLVGGGVGELDVQLLADQFLSTSDAQKAAEGWDGGRLVAAESSSGVLVGALTVWDSQSEAREAQEILGRWLPARYDNNGGDFRPSGGAVGRGWQSSTGAGEVVRSGSKVLLILGPDKATVEKARSAFSGF